LTANIAGNQIGLINFKAIKGTVFLWFLFYAVEAGIFFIALWEYQKTQLFVLLLRIVAGCMPMDKGR
jgi:hypothetical protein